MLFLGPAACLCLLAPSAGALSWRDCANQEGDWYKTPEAGRIYTLQRNTSLDGVWTPLTSQGPLASDGPVSLTDTSAPADTSFYRIEVSTP